MLVCVDTGTTNTRVWLASAGEVIARADALVGVRDTARDGHNGRLVEVLRELIRQVLEQAGFARPAGCSVLAAGMITSALGLEEVPHVQAPAGPAELAAAVRRLHRPDISELPILLVPGVRSGAMPCSLQTVSESDIMRGEETLALGLVAEGMLRPPGRILNLGSHWKLIDVDSQGRVAGSHTSLSGELIHATQTQTILASSVAQGRPESLDRDWLEAGIGEQQRQGLARALFEVRLLEQSRQGTPEQRMAFLVGAYLGHELDAWQRAGRWKDASEVLVAGHEVLADACSHLLRQRHVTASVIQASQVERGFLAGLHAVERLVA